MLLRHPDVQFYEIDRVAFGLLVLGAVRQSYARPDTIVQGGTGDMADAWTDGACDRQRCVPAIRS